MGMGGKASEDIEIEHRKALEIICQKSLKNIHIFSRFQGDTQYRAKGQGVRGLGEKGVRGKVTSRFIKNDYGKVPELKVSKIIEKY